MTSTTFQMYLFSTDKGVILPAVAAGVAGLVIDWEIKGKHERQRWADTQISSDTVEDLRSVRSWTDATIICRINPITKFTDYKKEIMQAIDNGADEILIPMVRTMAQIESVLDFVQGRCAVGILIETMAAARIAGELGTLPLKRVYVGLNDLAIDRGKDNIFSAIEDGTVETIRKHLTIPFGFAGLTLPDKGVPIPAPYLYNEMARLQCAFTFLRRSFLRDTHGQDLERVVPAMWAALEEAFRISESRREKIYRDLALRIQNMDGTLFLDRQSA